MAELVSLRTPAVLQAESVNRCLDDARDKGFQSILIIGVMADGTFCTSSSQLKGRLQLIGALECIKHDVLDLE